MKRLFRLAALLAAVTIAACDYSYGPNKLQPGASIDEVRKQMGAATDEQRSPDGSRIWWYVRGPQGFHTYKVRIGADEKVIAIEQVLTEANFRNIVADQSTQAAVQALLGRPREKMAFAMRAEEVWTWRYQDGTFNKYLHVHFTTAGEKPGLVTKYVLEQESTAP